MLSVVLEFNQKLYCEECLIVAKKTYAEQIAHDVGHDALEQTRDQTPCPRCNQRLSGRVFEALGQEWHAGCFLCALCEQPFDSVADGCFVLENKAYHAECSEKVSSQQPKDQLTEVASPPEPAAES